MEIDPSELCFSPTSHQIHVGPSGLQRNGSKNGDNQKDFKVPPISFKVPQNPKTRLGEGIHAMTHNAILEYLGYVLKLSSEGEEGWRSAPRYAPLVRTHWSISLWENPTPLCASFQHYLENGD